MNQQTLETNRRRQIIMRRVWYSFVLSIITNPGLALGLVFGITLQVFRDLVFVARVIENFLATEIGQVPQFVIGTLQSADTASVLALAVMVAAVWLCYRYTKTNVTSLSSTQTWQIG